MSHPIEVKDITPAGMTLLCQQSGEAWIIHRDDILEWEVDWEWLYGELPMGRYRMSKEIMDFRKTGDYDGKNYYAVFDVEG